MYKMKITVFGIWYECQCSKKLWLRDDLCITVNVQPAALVTHRPITTLSQTVSIAKVFPPQSDAQQQGPQSAANVFIHAPIASVPRRPSPGK